MGMQAEFEQISPQMLSEFIDQPRAAYEHFLARMNNQAEGAIPQLMQHLAAASKHDLPPEIKARIEQGIDQYRALMKTLGQSKEGSGAKVVAGKTFSLEKDWHILHYAINGTTEGGQGSLAEAILGGKEIPDHDGVMGYGPLRYLAPDQVVAVAEELARVDPKLLLSRLDRRDAEAKKIYLAHTLDRLDDWSYLPELFQQFRAFYADAARDGNAMLLCIT